MSYQPPTSSLRAWAVLGYLLIAPPVAVVGLLLALGAASLGADLLGALPAMIGFGYVVCAIPAIVTGFSAALTCRAQRWWQRLAVPFAVAVVAGVGFARLVLYHFSSPTPEQMTAMLIAAAAAGLLPGLVLELVRRGRLAGSTS